MNDNIQLSIAQMISFCDFDVFTKVIILCVHVMAFSICICFQDFLNLLNCRVFLSYPEEGKSV